MAPPSSSGRGPPSRSLRDAAVGSQERRRKPSGRGWGAWLFGIAVLAAVILVALHFSEAGEFAAVIAQAQIRWLALALVLQAGTYLAQGEIWRRVAAAARVPVSVGLAYRLSLAKLFLDQALPSAGISGTVVMARTFEEHAVPRDVVMAAVVVNNATYYAAFLLALGLALPLSPVHGHAGHLMLAVACLFALFGAGMIGTTLGLAGRGAPRAGWVTRLRPLERLLALIGAARPALARNPGLLAQGLLLQMGIVLLDAATIWVLIHSVGGTAPPVGVFASFMLSTLLRTIGVVPGGLGTYEAASVVTLKLIGVPIAVALAATLLFRVVSFWLPMLPGLAFSRGLRRAS